MDEVAAVPDVLDNHGPEEGGNILNKTARKNIPQVCHFQLRQRVVSKCLADPFKTKRTLIVTEEFTTKTSPLDGTLHHSIGGSTKFRCPCGCEFVGGRNNVGSWNARAWTKNDIVLR